ncbi:MAG: hypothetical protein GX085_00485 [Firmicutes bacterium]|nr:hypothetical protein [Bacillota bacterium]
MGHRYFFSVFRVVALFINGQPDLGRNQDMPVFAPAAGADFVKTSTGFTPGGATVEDVTLLYKAVGDKIKIKASGGIRNYDQAMSLLKAGAERLGASRAHLLMEPLEK